jgi:gliding motility-associated protein GldM
MINMMYLVLIALLALNVSREILKSFYLFELSYINANTSTEIRNAELMNAFKSKMDNPKAKARTQQWYQLALQTRNISKQFCAYVETIKTDIVTKGGGREVPTSTSEKTPELKKPDDMEAHAHYFIDEGLGKGKILQQKINATRLQLCQILHTARNGVAVAAALERSSQLKAIDPPKSALSSSTWVSQYLENAPLASVVTLLTKTQHDCKVLESEVLAVLSENINISTLTNDAQMAMIIPEQSAVMSGEMFKARVALVTYDSKTGARMLVNGQPISVQNGIGSISIPAAGSGSHSLTAQIESIDPNTGNPVFVTSPVLEWQSFQASATISADNMNVLFAGLDNPMSVSIPGITPENTFVSATNGIQIKSLGKGKFVANVTGNAKEGAVIVKAKMQDGSIKQMGQMLYQLRRVPKPKFRLGSLEEGAYEKSVIMAQQNAYALLEDFYFKGVKYQVVKFHATLVSPKSILTPDQTVVGSSTAQLKTLLKSAKSGDYIYIDQIRVSGPNGEISLKDFTLKIK